MNAAKYRKKPVVVEAVEFSPESGLSPEDIAAWCGGKLSYRNASVAHEAELRIKTLEGTMTASAGDFIIKGVNGEFYPCKPDIFEKTYEPVIAT